MATSDEPALDALAVEQRALAILGATLMNEVVSQHQPRVIHQERGRPTNVQQPTMPMGIQVQPPSVEPLPGPSEEDKPTDLPSLDTLLGLEETAPTRPMPPVPDDALVAIADRLMQAADALQDDADRLASRLQIDVLSRIDALLRQAEQQRQGDPGGSSNGDQTAGQSQLEASGGEHGQPGRAPAGAEPSGDAGDGVQAAMEPRMGGTMEHRGAAWGTLPPRLRAMLEQGRRDDTSMLYADICAEYFRMLLEAPAP
jgi:hypothetical protein